MKYAGPHVSIAGGVFNAPSAANKINAGAFGLFTKNQKQWNASPLTENDRSLFKESMSAGGYLPEHVLPHDSYLINLGNPDVEKREKSTNAFIDEMSRAGFLGLKYLNFHPGSHLGLITEDECIELIAMAINKAAAATESYGVIAVIETTAGQGTNIGYRFEHIRKIIDLMDNKKRAGVCIDTCHIYSAGYDIKTADNFAKVMDEFDRVIGLEYLKGMHLNDSKKVYGSKVDRHETLGNGTLGIEPFRYIMNQKIFDDIPLVLETPDPDLWENEIKLLYSLQE